jgi:hypothetical protein
MNHTGIPNVARRPLVIVMLLLFGGGWYGRGRWF